MRRNRNPTRNDVPASTIGRTRERSNHGRRLHWATVVQASLACVLMIGCSEDTDPRTEAGPTSREGEARSVVVYCSVDAVFAGPVLDAFEQHSGVKVYPVFDTEAGKTTGLVNKLLAERQSPRADVWWSGEVFGTVQLAESGVLAPYRPTTAADIPAQYRHPDGLWTAFGLRGRVLAYDPKRVRPENLPTRWCDLTREEFRDRIALADPRFGTTRGHMATLLSLWGPEAMADFYRGLRRNGYRRADGNSHAVLLLSRGIVDMVATDTDDVVVAQRRGDSIAVVYPDLDAPDGGRRTPGTLWIPSSVALVKGARNAAAARRLIDYLASAETEEKLYRSRSRSVPVRPGLRLRLGAVAPGEAAVDLTAAAARLDESDRLVNDVLLE